MYLWLQYLSLKPGLLRPKTIDDRNFYTIVAKCNQIEIWNKNQTTRSYFYFAFVWVIWKALSDIRNIA